MKDIKSRTIISDSKQNYTIQSELGKGGFANVYKALGDDGVAYAVKVINDYDPVYIKSFRNEFDIASRVNSPNAIKYYYLNDYDNNDFPCYMIMEYADGGNLENQIKQHRVARKLYDTAELKDIFLQLIGG